MAVTVWEVRSFLNDFNKLSTECHWTSNPSKFMLLFISVGDSCEQSEQDLALVMNKCRGHQGVKWELRMTEKLLALGRPFTPASVVQTK